MGQYYSSITVENSKRVIINFALSYFTPTTPFFIHKKGIEKAIEIISQLACDTFQLKKNQEIDSNHLFDIQWTNSMKNKDPGLNLLYNVGFKDIITKNKPRVVIIPMKGELADYAAIMLNEYESLVPYYILSFVRDQIRIEGIDTFDPYWMCLKIDKWKFREIRSRTIGEFPISSCILQLWKRILFSMEKEEKKIDLSDYVRSTFFVSPFANENIKTENQVESIDESIDSKKINIHTPAIKELVNAIPPNDYMGRDSFHYHRFHSVLESTNFLIKKENISKTSLYESYKDVIKSMYDRIDF